MFKLTSVIMALASTVAAAPAYVACDPQMSCDQVLSKNSTTPVTGSKCYKFYSAGKNYQKLDKATQEEFAKAGFPTTEDSNSQTRCLSQEDVKSGFGKLFFNVQEA